MDIITHGFTGRLDANAVISEGNPLKVRKRPKIIAPVTITIIMQATFNESIKDRTKPFQLSFFLIRAITRAKNAPAAPASVGVNNPKKRPAMTSINKKTISKAPGRLLILSMKLEAGPPGPAAGFIMHIK